MNSLDATMQNGNKQKELWWIHKSLKTETQLIYTYQGKDE